MAEKSLPKINFQRCDRCGKCVAACPEDALVMAADGPNFIQPLTCTYCMICETVCPQAAIRVPLTAAWSPQAR